MADLFTNWEDAAYALLRSYAQTHYEFLGEHVIRAAQEEGISAGDVEAWRVVAGRAITERVMVRAGMTPAGAANPPPRAIWRSLVYRGQKPQ